MSGELKVSILVSDLSENPIVRVYPIAKVLERKYSVEIIGPIFEERIFPAYAKEFVFKTVPGCNYPGFFRQMLEIIRRIEGDVIYVFKPRPSSFFPGLLASCLQGKPLVVDIDDWELAPYYEMKKSMERSVFFRRFFVRGWKAPNDYKYTVLANSLVRFATQVIVVSDNLLKRFGGTKVCHGVDTDFFDPRLCSPKNQLRKKWQIPSRDIVILFAGTPRLHKGLDDLLRAMALVESENRLTLLVVGGQLNGQIPTRLFRKMRSRIREMGYLPHEVMPDLLLLSDLVVLPQKKSLIAKAQVPAKVFEAMAMAKPIIATALSDLPEILEDCGIVIRPGDIEALAQNIQNILENPRIGSMMGAKAREKCIRLYSYEAIEKILIPVFRRFEKRLHS